MVEQTFRSPGFFEREIDLAARRQATSGIPGGVVGTAAKGPAFVPVTVGDFTDFINRFGDLHPDLPAVYAAFEFLKNKRALTFMRVLGAGGNATAADRDNTRTAGIVKGAGFKVHGATSANLVKRAAGVRAVSQNLLQGGVYFITANHDLNVAGSSQSALVTYPILNDNPSVQVNRGAETQLLRGVVYTTSGYRLTAMASADTFTYSDYDPAGDDVNASVKIQGTTANADYTFGDKITLISHNGSTPNSKTYVVVDSVNSDTDSATAQTALVTGNVLGARALITAALPTDLANKLELDSVADDNAFTITVPVNAGGPAAGVQILIDATGLPDEADNRIGINANGIADTAIRDLVVKAINGVAGDAKIRFAAAGTSGDNDPAGGALQAQAAVGGIPGIFAINGNDGENITLRATRPGEQAHSVTFANNAGTVVFEPGTSFSGGAQTAGAENDIALALTDASTIADFLTQLRAALVATHGAAFTYAAIGAAGGKTHLVITQAVKGQSGNTSITNTVDNLEFVRTDTDAAIDPIAFALGDGGNFSNVLQTDGRAAIASSEFKLLIISSDNKTIYRTITTSLDPEHPSYISKVLNTDPHKFKSTNHLLYLDLPVENELAPAIEAFVAAPSDAEISDSPFSGDYAKAWSTMGRMDTRYTTAHTPAIISQPFGTQEFDIMTFESLSDGAAGNREVKISIANIKASLDEANPHGTFEVQVRKAKDLDSDPEILESYPGCTLDSNSENFVARLIGDYNTFYNFDADEDEERRLIVRGKYPNRSLYVRVKMSDVYERGELPEEALPFGFRGIPVLKTSESLTDSAKVTITQDGAPVGKVLTDAQLISGATDAEKTRVNTKLSEVQTAVVLKRISSPIFPPFPMRFKITRGKMKSTIGGSAPSGDPEITEKVDPKLYWGMKPERLPRTASVDSAVLNPNAGGIFNELITGYTKFQGMLQTGALLSGSSIDLSNANKFTLAKVALNAAGSVTNIAEHVTGSAREHMLEAVYLRDATVDGSNYTVEDPGYGTRITLATLLSSSSVKFNRFTAYSKFSLPLFGGFDGLNILDKDMHLMNDRSSSTDAPSGFFGKASAEFDGDFTTLTGLNEGKPGIGARNSMVMTYNQAVLIMTDAMTVRHNILAVPGIRDSFVTDYAAERVKAYSLALYLMDIPAYSQDMTRLFGTEDRQAVTTLASTSPDIRETAEQFSSRVVDNNFSAAYFPDVVIADTTNLTQVTVPASVAAMKALAFSDSVSFPWFAPAGFNRGALDNVTNVDTRLTAGDRDELYDARINPIANFPNGGFVIFGQKTLQLAKSALDRVNVRRMLLEVKRLISRIAERLLFEPNNIETRARFINLVTPLLATVQAQAGIDSFQVVMDDTNNTDEDVESNRLNGRIVVVPTRAIEFIAIDFIITNSGVSFE